MVGAGAGYAAVWGPGRQGRDTKGLTAGRGQWVELLRLLQEALGLFAVAGVQGLPGDLHTFLRFIPVPLHGLCLLPFPLGVQLEGRKPPPPRRRGQPGWGRAEASGEERSDRGGGGSGSVQAGSQLRLFTVASPPPAGRYGASRISRFWSELPGLGVQADWAVRAQSRGSEPRG